VESKGFFWLGWAPVNRNFLVGTGVFGAFRRRRRGGGLGAGGGGGAGRFTALATRMSSTKRSALLEALEFRRHL